MIILTAGHTGPNTGAQCAETHFDEGAENIWLRNRIAEILTNKYGLVVLVDDDRASLKLLVKELSVNNRNTDPSGASASPPNSGGQLDRRTALKTVPLSQGDELTNEARAEAKLAWIMPCKEEVGKANLPGGGLSTVDHRPLTVDDIIIDIHFNAHSNPQARGAETIVSDDATSLELRFATRLAHVTADALDIPLRSIKSESETPHRRLGMLHLTPQSVILEVCFCTSPEDVEAYRKHREQLAEALAKNIAKLVKP